MSKHMAVSTISNDGAWFPKNNKLLWAILSLEIRWIGQKAFRNEFDIFFNQKLLKIHFSAYNSTTSKHMAVSTISTDRAWFSKYNKLLRAILSLEIRWIGEKAFRNEFDIFYNQKLLKIHFPAYISRNVQAYGRFKYL